MSERLSHLHRQQALLREHLAWIEAEIARETGHDSQPVLSHAAAAPAQLPPISAPLVPTSAESLPEADALLEKYASGERQNPADIRRGCFIVFIAALALLAAGVTTVWLLFYS
jgi:hypothetical protein